MNHKYSTIAIVIVIFILLTTLFIIPKQLTPISEFISTNIVSPLTGRDALNGRKSNSAFVEKDRIDYSVKRPNWTQGEVPKVNGENIIDTIAYTDNCTYVLVNTAIKISNTDLNNYLNEIINNQISSYFIKINKKVIDNDHIYIEGTFKDAKNNYYAVGKGFFSKDKKNLYFMIFTGKPDKFEEFCRPYIDETFNSFKLQK